MGVCCCPVGVELFEELLVVFEVAGVLLVFWFWMFRLACVEALLLPVAGELASALLEPVVPAPAIELAEPPPVPPILNASGFRSSELADEPAEQVPLLAPVVCCD